MIHSNQLGISRRGNPNDPAMQPLAHFDPLGT